MDEFNLLKDINVQNVIDEFMSSDLGNGPLCLNIGCAECNAEFELNHDAVTWAIITKASFIEFVRFVQHSRCPKCGIKTDALTDVCEGIEEKSL